MSDATEEALDRIAKALVNEDVMNGLAVSVDRLALDMERIAIALEVANTQRQQAKIPGPYTYGGQIQ